LNKTPSLEDSHIYSLQTARLADGEDERLSDRWSLSLRNLTSDIADVSATSEIEFALFSFWASPFNSETWEESLCPPSGSGDLEMMIVIDDRLLFLDGWRTFWLFSTSLGSHSNHSQNMLP
jgi:hypothetical protein